TWTRSSANTERSTSSPPNLGHHERAAPLTLAPPRKDSLLQPPQPPHRKPTKLAPANREEVNRDARRTAPGPAGLRVRARRDPPAAARVRLARWWRPLRLHLGPPADRRGSGRPRGREGRRSRKADHQGSRPLRPVQGLDAVEGHH